MNFKELDRDVAKSLDIPIETVRDVLAETERQMNRKILFGQELSFRNIGKLELVISKARKRYDVTRDTYFDCDAKYRLRFKPSSVLSKKLRKKIVYDGKKEILDDQ